MQDNIFKEELDEIGCNNKGIKQFSSLFKDKDKEIRENHNPLIVLE